MEISNAEVGKRIRQVRKERGYTQEQLAELSDISLDFLGAVETGRRGMKIQNLAKIAHALDVSADYLLYGTMPFKENAKINTMLSALTNDERKQVEKLITVFVDTVRLGRTSKTEEE